MKALVTGATGFIGSNLARELLASGYQVRALARPGADLRNLQGLDIEISWGDLRQPQTLGPALEGCSALFHVAAAYTFWASDPRVIYETNVQGTENILAAARKKEIDRVVYTSSVATIGLALRGAPATEDTPLHPRALAGHYKKSKHLAETVALRYAREMPVVIVNPSTPLGPGDIKPTPTGRIVLDFLNGRMPAYVNTGFNVIHVRDVARGHILALEKGKTGQRYILGYLNLTMKELLGKLAQVTGLRAPRFRLPLPLALALAYLDEALEGKLLRREPRIPLEGVKSARRFMYYDPSRAIRELGLPQTPIEVALEEAVAFFQGQGMVRRPLPALLSPAPTRENSA